MIRYRSKPSEIEAVQWTGYLGDLEHLIEADKVRFDADVPGARRGEDGLEILAGKDGAQGWVPVPRDHWIVNNPGDLSDIWPVDPDYFEAKYELAEDL